MKGAKVIISKIEDVDRRLSEAKQTSQYGKIICSSSVENLALDLWKALLKYKFELMNELGELAYKELRNPSVSLSA